MDERELSKMFRDAAGHPPPASFDHEDVLGASRRAVARRRSALAGGSLLGVAVLGGGVLLGGQLLQPTAPKPPTEPPPAVATAPGPSPGGRMATPDPMPDPMPQPMRTLDAPGTGGRAATGPASCGPADPVLAAELDDALDERLPAPPGPTVPLTEPCPAGSRAAGVPVSTGTIYLVVSPAVTGAGEGGSTRPDGARSYTVASPRTGDLVSVLAVPASPQRPAPLGEQVDELARELAARL